MAASRYADRRNKQYNCTNSHRRLRFDGCDEISKSLNSNKKFLYYLIAKSDLYSIKLRDWN